VPDLIYKKCTRGNYFSQKVLYFGENVGSKAIAAIIIEKRVSNILFNRYKRKILNGYRFQNLYFHT